MNEMYYDGHVNKVEKGRTWQMLTTFWSENLQGRNQLGDLELAYMAGQY
jgi:hypothetical protein